MDLQGLNIFIQVAELKNFTKAGKKLGYSQPTVSFQIKQLEEELGTKLFDRIGHTVMLTEAGHHALEYAQTICRMSEEMIMGAGKDNAAKGVIRIGLPDSLCTPFIVNRFEGFRNNYPEISLEITNAGTDTMFHLLDHNLVDIICTLDSPIYDTNYVLAHEERIGTSFVVSADNPLATKKKISIKDILKQNIILTERGMSYRRLLDERLAKEGIEINPMLEFGRTDLICDMVEDNIGISFLPDFVTEDGVKSGKLVRINVKGYEIDVWKQLVYRREKWISKQMKAIIEHMAVNVI